MREVFEFILYIRVNKTKNSPRKSVQIVEGKRDKTTGKVKTKIVEHVGIAQSDDEVEKLHIFAAQRIVELENQGPQQAKLFDDTNERIEAKKLGRPKKKKIEDILPPEQVSLADIKEEKRINMGVNDVAGQMFIDLGCDKIMKSKKQTEVLKDLVLSRFVQPQSKLKTCKWLGQNFDKTYDSDQIYYTLDQIHKQIPRIKKLVFNKTKSLLPEILDILFFDVTTLYFEALFYSIFSLIHSFERSLMFLNFSR